MFIIQNVGDAWKVYLEAMGALISDGIRRLLSEKHLYQSITLDDDVARNAVRPIPENIKKRCEELGTFMRGVSQYAWQMSGDEGPFRPEDGRPGHDFVPFTLPHAKMYCTHCKQREVFNVEAGNSMIKTWEYQLPVVKGMGTINQVYSLVYLCQNCRKFPEVFLVRREGGKLRLCGRSEMENVEVPSYVPKEIADFYSGAVIAYQSNQVLPANFMLRTAIEQWSIRSAEPGVQGGDAVAAYTASLPDDFKQHFPSLYELYSKLSEDIHAAKGSPELFVAMSEKFLEHFDARRVRKLTGPKQ